VFPSSSNLKINKNGIIEKNPGVTNPAFMQQFCGVDCSVI